MFGYVSCTPTDANLRILNFLSPRRFCSQFSKRFLTTMTKLCTLLSIMKHTVLHITIPSQISLEIYSPVYSSSTRQRNVLPFSAPWGAAVDKQQLLCPMGSCCRQTACCLPCMFGALSSYHLTNCVSISNTTHNNNKN